ncbi:UNVERIFIED_CONTAM: hypothetical protein FKN15_073192 [Acipenser sinensis]
MLNADTQRSEKEVCVAKTVEPKRGLLGMINRTQSEALTEACFLFFGKMGTSHEADRTLFVGNLDSNVTEELLFELFLQLYSMWQQQQQQGNGAVSPLIQPGYQASGQQHRQGGSGGSWQDLSAQRVHRQHSHQYQQDNEHCSRGSGSDRHVRGQHDDRMNHHNRSHSRDSRREDSRDGRWRQNRY